MIPGLSQTTITQVMASGLVLAVKELTELLAIHFKLTDSDRHELLPSGQQTIFSNRVAWAKSHLKNAGLIASPGWGKVTIAEAGLKTLRQNPVKINCKFLKQFPSYLKFIGAVPSTESALNPSPIDDAALEGITPANFRCVDHRLSKQLIAQSVTRQHLGPPAMAVPRSFQSADRFLQQSHRFHGEPT